MVNRVIFSLTTSFQSHPVYQYSPSPSLFPVPSFQKAKLSQVEIAIIEAQALRGACHS
ncbi:hypothetical protein C1H46_003482 [Malus baccata]|uniref:Uncharacterized protein n=1 Tax=Malus baccata TaxID=106549 RepID=A0A540NIS6_MALBA|nr:hypothetical protein C1H46_003482 [Malus baccata]